MSCRVPCGLYNNLRNDIRIVDPATKVFSAWSMAKKRPVKHDQQSTSELSLAGFDSQGSCVKIRLQSICCYQVYSIQPLYMLITNTKMFHRECKTMLDIKFRERTKTMPIKTPIKGKTHVQADADSTVRAPKANLPRIYNGRHLCGLKCASEKTSALTATAFHT